MRLPIEIATYVSAELSALIERFVNDPDVEEPVTLGVVRAGVAGGAPDALVVELDALIEQCSDNAQAVDFAAVQPSEQLCVAIEAMMNDPATRRRLTLHDVRQSLLYEDETLLAEIDDLIERFGAEALADYLMRYE